MQKKGIELSMENLMMLVLIALVIIFLVIALNNKLGLILK